MKYTFKIRDPKTGLVKDLEDDYDYEDLGHMIYQWTEGNYSCDCNRSIFLYGYDKKYECGETIELLKITARDGTEVEFEDHQ